MSDALRRVLTTGGEVTVMMVVSARADDDEGYEGDLLDFDGMQLSQFS